MLGCHCALEGAMSPWAFIRVNTIVKITKCGHSLGTFHLISYASSYQLVEILEIADRCYMLLNGTLVARDIKAGLELFMKSGISRLSPSIYIYSCLEKL